MPGRNRILIVDDEPVIANTLATVFAQQGYESRAALSAEQAVEHLTSWHPEMAIVDIYLKKTDGVELAMYLRERCPNCQVALFTGVGDLTNLLDKAYEAGHHFEVFQKPVHPKTFLELAASWLAGPEESEMSVA